MSDAGRRVVRRCTHCFDEFWSLASEYASYCPPCTRRLRTEVTATRDDLQRALVEGGLAPESGDARPPSADPLPQWVRFSTLSDPYIWTPPPTRRDADEPLVTADVAHYLEEWFAKESV